MYKPIEIDKKRFKFLGNSTDPSNRMWDEYEDTVTGRKSLSIIKPRKISNFDKCQHHYSFEVESSSAVCDKCGIGVPIVWGINIIKDGKIVKPNTR